MKNNKKDINLLFIFCLILFIFCLFFVSTLISIYLTIYYKNINNIYTEDCQIENYSVGIVFGAGYYESGQLTAILKDRVDTAIALYKKGKIKKILMTGANNTPEYNETAAMINYAIRNGVPKEDLQPDYAGFRTYDSLYRAKEVFIVEKAILITQRYHLFRALYIADKLGIEAIGVDSNKRRYLNEDWYKTREFFAIILSFIETNITKPKPRFLGEKIPILP